MTTEQKINTINNEIESLDEVIYRMKLERQKLIDLRENLEPEEEKHYVISGHWVYETYATSEEEAIEKYEHADYDEIDILSYDTIEED